MAEMMMRLLDSPGNPQGGNLPQFATGTYTGDGNATKAIAGLGFRPIYVLIWDIDADSGDGNIGHKNDQDGLNAWYYDVGTTTPRYVTDQIISLDVDGFTVGDGTGTANWFNVVGDDYYYVCWGVVSPAYQASGQYVGDGNATQAIVGLGFQPKFVTLSNLDAPFGGAGVGRVWRTNLDAPGIFCAFYSSGFAFWYTDDMLNSLDADGFTVGDGTGFINFFNEIGCNYRYVAWG